MTLGEVVDTLIKEHGSPREASKALGISQGHLTNLKHGHGTIRPERKTLDKLGVRVRGDQFEWVNRPNGRRIPKGWGFR